jgi:hypothetical protein
MAIKVKDYAGPETLKKMQQTKWMALANALGQILYSGHAVDTHYLPSGGLQILMKGAAPALSPGKHFIVGVRQYIGSDAPAQFDGRDDAYCDVEKTLRTLMHECERMAMREST